MADPTQSNSIRKQEPQSSARIDAASKQDDLREVRSPSLGEERETELEQSLAKHGVTSPKMRDLFQAELNDPQVADDVMSELASWAAEGKSVGGFDPAAVLASARRAEPNAEDIKAVSSTLSIAKEAYKDIVKSLGGDEVARLRQAATELKEQYESGGFHELAGPMLDSSPEKPAVVQPESKELKPLSTTKVASSEIEFHKSNADGSLNKFSRSLALSEDGTVLEAGAKASDVAAVYIDKGKAYLANGREVSQLSWGGNTVSASRLNSYLEPLSSGKLSGIQDGYLKEMRVNGKLAVFTKGLPLGLQKSVSAAELKPTPKKEQQREKEADVAAKIPKKKVEQKIAKEELTLPDAPVKLALEKENPVKAVGFQFNYQGQTHTNVSNLRIAGDGNLQMQFGSGATARWLDPTNAPGRECACLYHQDGKLLDAAGNEVKSLQWGNGTTDAQFLLKYVEPLKQGEISTIKSGYLNEVRANGKRVVFTEGPPPGLADKELGSRPEATRERHYPTHVSEVSLSVKEKSGAYSGSSLQFRRDTSGELQVRASSQAAWQDGNNVSLTIGKTPVKLELLYRHEGKVFDGAGKEVTELSFSNSKFSAENFENGIFRYSAQRNDGGIYGMSSRYIGNVMHGNKHALFVNEAPPN